MQAVCTVGLAGICPELVYASDKDTTRIGSWGRRDRVNIRHWGLTSAQLLSLRLSSPSKEQKVPSLRCPAPEPCCTHRLRGENPALHPPSLSERWHCCELMEAGRGSRDIPGTSLPCSLLTRSLRPLPTEKKAELRAAALDPCCLLRLG